MPHVDLEGTANPMLRTHGDISLGSGKTKRAKRDSTPSWLVRERHPIVTSTHYPKSGMVHLMDQLVDLVDHLSKTVI